MEEQRGMRMIEKAEQREREERQMGKQRKQAGDWKLKKSRMKNLGEGGNRGVATGGEALYRQEVVYRMTSFQFKVSKRDGHHHSSIFNVL